MSVCIFTNTNPSFIDSFFGSLKKIIRLPLENSEKSSQQNIVLDYYHSLLVNAVCQPGVEPKGVAKSVVTAMK